MVPTPGRKMFRQRQKLARPGVILLIAEIGQHIGMMMMLVRELYNY
jgi:hypothetical protein